MKTVQEQNDRPAHTRQQKIAEFAQSTHRVLPIIDIDNAELIVPTIDALSRGGVGAVEITLRTSAGFDAITLAQQAFPDMILVAGTVTSAQQVEQLKDTGIHFAISPGISEALLKASQTYQLELLPGITTASEILLGLEFGLSYFKFFPAQASGGTAMLRSLQGPFPQLQFCATGGITPDNALDYLALDNTFCIGGSWIANKQAIENHQWESIYQQALAITQALSE